MSVEKKSQLSDKQLSILESEMKKYGKSVGVAYLLLIFLGTLGIHKFYLGKTLWGTVYLLLGIIGLGSWFAGSLVAFGGIPELAGSLGAIGSLCLGILSILILIDLFTLPRQVRKIYEKAEEKITNELLLSQKSQES